MGWRFALNGGRQIPAWMSAELQPKRGPYLIAVEGLDGAGKTTLARRIEAYMRDDRGQDVEYVSAISDDATLFGKWIGNVLKDPMDSFLHDVECALMIAARVDCEQRRVKPWLESGCHVVSDRYKTSLFVYQKGTDGRRINRGVAQDRLASFGLARNADLNIILDIDPAKAHHELDGQMNRLEDRSYEEWQDMRQAFLAEYEMDFNAVLVDASQSADAVFEESRRYVDALLEGKRIGWLRTRHYPAGKGDADAET